jgi:hypothetical protein
MSNFSHEIFQSGLSLPLSESHNNWIKTNDIIAFKFVSKLNATVLFLTCVKKLRIVLSYMSSALLVRCFAGQMLPWSDVSLVRCNAFQLRMKNDIV